MSQQRHTSDPRILDARTVEDDFSALAPLLEPGMRVLDVGCGGGAITEGIAVHVGPAGRVVGVDRDDAHIARAAERSSGRPWLSFEHGDVLSLDYVTQFDLVCVARTLQWIARDDLGAAIGRLSRALVPGGRLVALDYNHAGHDWQPAPPAAMVSFVAAFRAWRQSHGWDDDVLALAVAHYGDAGLKDVQTRDASELVSRGGPRFEQASRIWFMIAETIGPRMVADGFLDEMAHERARIQMMAWLADELVTQMMAARVVIATRRVEE
jgi:SAM-dependent methyltransferase